MRLNEWIEGTVAMLASGAVQKIEGSVVEGKVKAYRVVNIIRIDFEPSMLVKSERS